MMFKKIAAVLLMIAALFLCPACGANSDSGTDTTTESGTGLVTTLESQVETITTETTVLTSTATSPPETTTVTVSEPTESGIDKTGSYTTKEDVALYIHTYGCLPQNFITKKEAKALGWEGGSLEPYAPGKCIGGDHFGNYEGLLPEAKGRSYTKCDIDTLGKKSRCAKRIIFSNDGLIYYTDDHYASFTLLYGEEDT